MITFPKIMQYALRGLIILNKDQLFRCQIKTILEDDPTLPEHFTRKAFQILVKHRILISNKGPKGGYSFNKSPKEINLYELMKIFDHPLPPVKCPIHKNHCTKKNPCTLYELEINNHFRLKDLLKKTTLQDLTL